ncbi:MAG TPA: hypothetical protein EYQ27_08400 [Gemmatimonadetes bacterium]|nr:hypothetical protein [Gemmatimonadota bacterium]
MKWPSRRRPTFQAGQHELLFSPHDYLGSDGRPQYDVSPDDQRFVMLRFGEATGMELCLIENFLQHVTER